MSIMKPNPDDKFVGIQVSPISFIDEGVDAVLDTLQNRVGVNVVGVKKSDGDFIINPGRDTPLDDACKLFVLGTVEQIRTLNRLLGIQHPQV